MDVVKEINEKAKAYADAHNQTFDMLYEEEDGIATIIINRPARRNAATIELYEQMIVAIEERVYKDDVRVLIITGSEEGRAFCAGADLKGMAAGRGITGEQAPRQRPVKRSPRDFNPDRIVMDLRNLPKPVIAMVNGIAVGAGFDISLWCDIRIASDQASFGQFYVRRGLVTDRGGTWFLPRLCGTGKAFEILTTGRLIDAEEAERIGIVNKVVPHAQLRTYTYDLAKQYTKLPPVSVGHIKFLMYENLLVPLESALAIEHYAMGVASGTEDSKEGVRAFVEKREPVFKGK